MWARGKAMLHWQYGPHGKVLIPEWETPLGAGTALESPTQSTLLTVSTVGSTVARCLDTSADERTQAWQGRGAAWLSQRRLY